MEHALCRINSFEKREKKEKIIPFSLSQEKKNASKKTYEQEKLLLL